MWFMRFFRCAAGFLMLTSLAGCPPLPIGIPLNNEQPAASTAFHPNVVAKEDWPEAAPLETRVIHLPNGIDMEMVHISAGRFTMGAVAGDDAAEADEQPAHDVVLTRDYWLATTELTRGMWFSFNGKQPWASAQYQELSGLNVPATGYTWEEAQDFLAQVNTLTGADFRLPTEAEWELACRAGTNTAFSFGDDARLAWLFGWHGFPDGTEPFDTTSLPANTWGFHDMHGNAAEFCQDTFLSDAYGTLPALDPIAVAESGNIVIRGGAVTNTVDRLRSSSRLSFPRAATPGNRTRPGMRLATNSPDRLPNDAVTAAPWVDLQWTQVAENTPWGPRAFHNAAVFGPQLVVLAGESVDNEGNTAVYNDVWRTKDGFTWDLLTDAAPWPPRSHASVALFDGDLWILGGRDAEGEPMADVWRSSDGVNWTEVTGEAPWGARDSLAAVQYRGYLLVCGGADVDGAPLRDIWYTEDSVVWTVIAKPARYYPRWGHAVAAHHGNMYVSGGFDAEDFVSTVCHSYRGTVWDVDANVPAYADRGFHGFTSFAGKLWVMGGETAAGPVADAWYSNDGAEWFTAETTVPWSARAGHAVVNAGSSLWVLGGEGDTGNLGDVWVALADAAQPAVDARLDGAWGLADTGPFFLSQDVTVNLTIETELTAPVYGTILRIAAPEAWELQAGKSDFAFGQGLPGADSGELLLAWGALSGSKSLRLVFKTGGEAGDATLHATLTGNANGQELTKDLNPLTVSMRVPDPPVADFTVSPTSGYAPLSVTVHDQSSAGSLPITKKRVLIRRPLGEYWLPINENKYLTLRDPGAYTFQLEVTDGYETVYMDYPETVVVTEVPPPAFTVRALPSGAYSPGGMLDIEVAFDCPLSSDRLSDWHVTQTLPEGWAVESTGTQKAGQTAMQKIGNQVNIVWPGPGTSGSISYRVRVPETASGTMKIAGSTTGILRRSSAPNEDLALELPALVIVDSGEPAPEVNFTATPSSGEAPLTVTLHDTTPGVVARRWYVDGRQIDGSGETVTKVLTDSGTHGIGLWVSNGTSFNQRFVNNMVTVRAELTPMRTIAGGPTYAPGETLTVELTLNSSRAEEIMALGGHEYIPPGWTLVRAEGAAKPAYITQNGDGNLEYFWIDVPDMPATFTYTLQVPESAAHTAEISGKTEYRTDGPLFESGITTTDLSIKEPEPDEQWISLTREIHGGPSFTPGSTKFITLHVNAYLAGGPKILNGHEALPPGWVYEGRLGRYAPDSMRQTEDGKVEYGWTEMPAVPFEFQYRLRVPEDAEGTAEIAGQIECDTDDYALRSESVRTTLVVEGTPAEPMDRMTLTREILEGNPYAPGGVVTIALTLNSDIPNALTALGGDESLPDEWTYLSVSGPNAPPLAMQTANGAFEYAWISVPTMPCSFTYTVRVPETPAEIAEISGNISYRTNGGHEESPTVDTSLIARKGE